MNVRQKRQDHGESQIEVEVLMRGKRPINHCEHGNKRQVHQAVVVKMKQKYGNGFLLAS